MSLTVFTQRNFVADFLQVKCDFREKKPFCVFEPPLGDLGATYDDHLRLGVTAEALRAIICSKSAISLQRGPVCPKFRVEGVVPTNHSSSQKTRLNYLSHGIKKWTECSSVLSQFTRLTDGRTNRQTDRMLIARPRLHFMQRDKNWCKIQKAKLSFI